MFIRTSDLQLPTPKCGNPLVAGHFLLASGTQHKQRPKINNTVNVALDCVCLSYLINRSFCCSHFAVGNCKSKVIINICNLINYSY